MERVPIMFICLVLGAVGFAVLILWIRDREGALGEFANWAMIGLMVITGVVCLFVGTRSLILHSEDFLSREFAFNTWTLLQLYIGIQVLWNCGKWFIGRCRGERRKMSIFNRQSLSKH